MFGGSCFHSMLGSSIASGLLGTTRSLDAFAKGSGIGRIFGREETRGVAWASMDVSALQNWHPMQREITDNRMIRRNEGFAERNHLRIEEVPSFDILQRPQSAASALYWKWLHRGFQMLVTAHMMSPQRLPGCTAHDRNLLFLCGFCSNKSPGPFFHPKWDPLGPSGTLWDRGCERFDLSICTEPVSHLIPRRHLIF